MYPIFIVTKSNRSYFIEWKYYEFLLILVQSRLSFQVTPDASTDEVSSENPETVDEPKNVVGVEEKMKNIPLPSDILSTDSEDKSKVEVPKADYMLGIAGRYLV